MPSGVSTSSWSKPDPDPPPPALRATGFGGKVSQPGFDSDPAEKKREEEKKKTNTEAKPEPLTTAKALRELAANPSLERTLQRNFPRPESPQREEALKLNFFCFVWEAGIPNPGRDAQIFIITVLPHVVHTRSCCLGCGGAAATGPGEQSPATAATAAGSSPNSPVPPSPAEPPPAKPAAHT